jgi:hypothetical protein
VLTTISGDTTETHPFAYHTTNAIMRWEHDSGALHVDSVLARVTGTACQLRQHTTSVISTRTETLERWLQRD